MIKLETTITAGNDLDGFSCKIETNMVEDNATEHEVGISEEIENIIGVWVKKFNEALNERL